MRNVERTGGPENFRLPLAFRKLACACVVTGKRNCFQFNVIYGGARNRGVEGGDVGLPSTFVLKLYDENVSVSQTARSNRDRLEGRQATPLDHVRVPALTRHAPLF